VIFCSRRIRRQDFDEALLDGLQELEYGGRTYEKALRRLKITALALSQSFGVTSDGGGPKSGLSGTSISCLHDPVLAMSMTATSSGAPASLRKLSQNR